MLKLVVLSIERLFFCLMRFLAHLTGSGELLLPLSVRRPSVVSFSHSDLLL